MPAGSETKAVRWGTHRVVPPEVTWERIEPLLLAMGITRVADLTGLDDLGVPVFQAVRPNGRTLSVSQGKGVTPMLARVSGAMECIELWHAEELPLSPMEATVGEMAGQLPYCIADLPQMHGSVLSDQTNLRWISARSFHGADEVGGRNNAETWLPQQSAWMDFTDAAAWRLPLLRCSTNGLASGNTLQEAQLHGLYEVLERDALASLPTVQSRAELVVDLATVEGASRWVLDRFAEAEAEVQVYDCTPSGGLPCFEANIWSRSFPYVSEGSGCHRDADVALSRALTEAAQARLTMVAGTRDDMPDRWYDRLAERTDLRCPLPDFPPSRAFSGHTARGTDLNEDLQVTAAIAAARAGGEVLWVDLTRPELGIPVVKVVAPGLKEIVHR